MSMLQQLTRIQSIPLQQTITWRLQQVRTRYADWRMVKDVKRRNIVKEFAKERLRVNAMRKNDVLPIEIKEFADKHIAAMPLNSNLLRVNSRCAITSRPRGTVVKWRLSRIVFRSLVDYNKMSGIQRAMW